MSSVPSLPSLPAVPRPSVPGVPEPRLWRYLLAVIFLVVVWVILLELWIRPTSLAVPGAAPARRLGFYLGPPMALVAGLYFLRRHALRQRQAREAERLAAAELQAVRQRRDAAAQEAAGWARKRFSLEVLALAVGVENLGLDQIWGGIQHQADPDRILSSDPDDFPGLVAEKHQASQARAARTLGGVLDWLSEEWPIPTFMAMPELHNPEGRNQQERELAECLAHAGGQARRMKLVEARYDSAPDAILNPVFAFFEAHLEVPAVLLVAQDGAVVRDALRPPGTPPLVTDGPLAPGEGTGSTVAFVLGRRDRLAPMGSSVQGGTTGYEALKPFWEKEPVAQSAATFSPTPWVPKVWSRGLLDRCLGLPLLAALQRPQYVDFHGPQGLMGEASRASVFTEGWQAALEGLGEGEKPEHLVFDHGPVHRGRRLTPLHRTLATLDPDFEPFDRGINLERHLGDTGAASPFLGLALGITASSREGGASASVCLRCDDRASIFMVSPPPAKIDSAG